MNLESARYATAAAPVRGAVGRAGVVEWTHL
jgi:hypothetical protein